MTFKQQLFFAKKHSLSYNEMLDFKWT